MKSTALSLFILIGSFGVAQNTIDIDLRKLSFNDIPFQGSSEKLDTSNCYSSFQSTPSMNTYMHFENYKCLVDSTGEYYLWNLKIDEFTILSYKGQTFDCYTSPEVLATIFQSGKVSNPTVADHPTDFTFTINCKGFNWHVEDEASLVFQYKAGLLVSWTLRYPFSDDC